MTHTLIKGGLTTKTPELTLAAALSFFLSLAVDGFAFDAFFSTFFCTDAQTPLALLILEGERT